MLLRSILSILLSYQENKRGPLEHLVVPTEPQFTMLNLPRLPGGYGQGIRFFRSAIR